MISMAGTIHHLSGQIDQIARPPIMTRIRISRLCTQHRVTAVNWSPDPTRVTLFSVGKTRARPARIFKGSYTDGRAGKS